MEDYQSLSHTKWECKYDVVFIAKYRLSRIFRMDSRSVADLLPNSGALVVAIPPSWS